MARLHKATGIRRRGGRMYALIHWRYATYSRVVDLRPYRRWLWSKTAAYRGLGQKRKKGFVR